MEGYAHRSLTEGMHAGRQSSLLWKLYGRATNASASNGRLRTWGFYGVAIISGLVIQSLLFNTFLNYGARKTPGPATWTCIEASSPSYTPARPHMPSPVREEYVRPGLGNLIEPNEDAWSLEAINEMVSQTKGYYARDYSVWLGWNNVRFR